MKSLPQSLPTFKVPGTRLSTSLQHQGEPTSSRPLEPLLSFRFPTVTPGRLPIAISRSAIITGDGFAANETGIAVHLGDFVVASGITANSNGSWSATIDLPPCLPALILSPLRVLKLLMWSPRQLQRISPLLHQLQHLLPLSASLRHLHQPRLSQMDLATLATGGFSTQKF